jgi:hypothetical protein
MHFEVSYPTLQRVILWSNNSQGFCEIRLLAWQVPTNMAGLACSPVEEKMNFNRSQLFCVSINITISE